MKTLKFSIISTVIPDVPSPGQSGLSEDPATGSATVAAAALLADLASERDGELKLRIGQGDRYVASRAYLLTRVRKSKRHVS